MIWKSRIPPIVQKYLNMAYMLFSSFQLNLDIITKCDIIEYITPCLYHTIGWNQR